MSVSERTSLWLAVVLTPLLFVYSYGRLDSKYASLKYQLVETNDTTTAYVDETRETMEAAVQDNYSSMHQLLVDLYARDSFCQKRSAEIESTCSALSLQIFSVEQVLSELGESVSAGGKEVELTQDQLVLLRDSLHKVQQELQQKEDLVTKIAHYLNTQVKVITPAGSGSGTLLAGGYVLSAAHVVGQSAQVSAKIGSRVFQLKLIKRSEEYDLALLKVDTLERLPFVKLRGHASKDLSLLSDVYVVGYPLGVGPFFTTGQLCGKTEEQDSLKDAWLLNANIYFGSSGGGVFDPSNGELVGVVVAMHAHGGMGISFMSCVVPGHRVAEWLEKAGVKID